MKETKQVILCPLAVGIKIGDREESKKGEKKE
jgi:hypothetical protein